jgi:APA family basic amino acid/polyamine antiporter
MSANDSVLRTKPLEDVLAKAGDAGSEADGHHLSRRLGAKDLMGFGIARPSCG